MNILFTQDKTKSGFFLQGFYLSIFKGSQNTEVPTSCTCGGGGSGFVYGLDVEIVISAEIQLELMV